MGCPIKRQADFLKEAQAAYSETIAGGKVYEASDVHRYAQLRAKGKQTRPPKGRIWPTSVE